MNVIADGSDWMNHFGVFLVSAALLAIERLVYAWVWNRPGSFRALALRARLGDPVTALEALFYAFKVIQLGVFALWCGYFGALLGWPALALDPARLVALALIATGQLLNAAVFLRLGRTGVFYGNRFGHRVEWREGFPFSLVAHPQYVGTVLTIWGVFVLFRYPFGDWIVLPLLQTAYYVCGAMAEERAPDSGATVEARLRQPDAP